MDKNKYAILILAAGSSERLGRPKQLVKRDTTTLLNHVIEQALGTENTDVFVALGGNQSNIRPTISKDINLLEIQNWQDGMGTTISSSLNQIDIDSYAGIILSVCDQPYISNNIFNKLINVFENMKASIVASRYKLAFGPPTLFSRKHYTRLVDLEGDIGAKKIINEHINEVSYILFPDGNIDIDIESDLKYLSVFKRKI